MNLREYLDTLPRGGVSAFAEKAGISVTYLAQLAARLDGREPSPELAVRIERESGGLACRSDLRPEDWRRIWPELAAAADATTPEHSHAAA